MAELEEVLRSFCDDIAAVDGYCCVCVRELVDGLNEQLEKQGVPFRYRENPDGEKWLSGEYVILESIDNGVSHVHTDQ